MDKSKNLIPYRKGNLLGYSDRRGEILIDCKFLFARPFEKGLGKVYSKPNKNYQVISDYLAGFIDESERIIIPINFISKDPFNQNDTVLMKETYEICSHDVDGFYNVVCSKNGDYIDLFEYKDQNFKRRFNFEEGEIYDCEFGKNYKTIYRDF